MTQKFRFMLLLVLHAAIQVNQMPISVPIDNYPDIDARLPNAHYNRLPGNRFPIKNDPIYSTNNDNSVTDEYEDYEEETSKRPLTSAQYTSSSYYNSNNNYSPVLTENFIKKKRRRKKVRRPCIPIQSFNSPLFTRYKREVEGKDSPKTLGLLFGGYHPFAYPPPIGTPFYGNYYGGGSYPNKPFYDNVKPENDDDRPQYDYNRPQYGSNRPQYDSNQNAPLYNPIGGYPCIPVSYGHVPHGGPFGFFGPGGLFDSGVSPSFNVPQTVIVNRPPLFGNKPPYFGNRPSYTNTQDGVENDGRPPGFWGNVVDKLSEFVSIY